MSVGLPEKERPGAHGVRVNPEVRKPPQPPHSAVQPNAAARQCAGDTVAGLHRRRAASRRLPVLDSSRSDPWHYEPPRVRGYEEAARHLLGHGLTPAPNSAALRELWKAGGESRAAAEAIADRWGLVA
jgi:hypothetical protein